MGNINFQQVASNLAQISDPPAVLQIFDRYCCSFDFDMLEVGDEGYLAISGKEVWPYAVFRDDLGDLYRPGEPGFWTYLEGAFQIGGKAGFIQLLCELAPFLRDPLTVQAVDFSTCGYDLHQPIRVCEWHIKPGATEVEINELKHADEILEAVPARK